MNTRAKSYILTKLQDQGITSRGLFGNYSLTKELDELSEKLPDTISGKDIRSLKISTEAKVNIFAKCRILELHEFDFLITELATKITIDLTRVIENSNIERKSHSASSCGYWDTNHDILIRKCTAFISRLHDILVSPMSDTNDSCYGEVYLNQIFTIAFQINDEFPDIKRSYLTEIVEYANTCIAELCNKDDSNN